MTIREMITQKAYDLLVVVGVGLFVGFLSPFGMDALPLYVSISYWVIICVVGYLVYHPIIDQCDKRCSPFLTSLWQRVAMGAFVASVPMSFLVPLVTTLYFGKSVSMASDFFNVFPKTLVIGGVITIVSLIKETLVEQQAQLEQSPTISDTQLSKFLALLPVEKRGQLYAFESADHYLKVYTDKGHHLLLMRFKDAVDMLEDYPGLQTHRSWWVAISAVAQVTKENRKTLLILENNLKVPVSKTYADDVKNSGIH